MGRLGIQSGMAARHEPGRTLGSAKSKPMATIAQIEKVFQREK